MNVGSRKITLYRKKSVECFGNNFHSVRQIFNTIGLWGKYQTFCAIFYTILSILLDGNWTMLNNYFAREFHSNQTTSWSFRNKNYGEEFCISYLAGHAIGSVVGAHGADNLGRLRVIFPTISTSLVVGILLIACTNYKAIVVMQIFIGILLGKIQTTITALIMEVTDYEYRLLPSLCTTGSLAGLLLALLTFLTTSWQHYTIMIHLTAMPLLYMCLLLQESPRWLIIKGHLSKAALVISDLSSEIWTSGQAQEVHKNQLVLLQSEGDKHKKYSIITLLRRYDTAKHIIFITLAGISHATTTWAVKNQVIICKFGCVVHQTLHGCLATILLVLFAFFDFKVKRLSHRQSLFTAVLIEIILIAALIIQYYVPKNDAIEMAIMWLSLLISVVNDSVHVVLIYQIVATLQPTVCRAIGFGTFFFAQDVTLLVLRLISIYYDVATSNRCVAAELHLLIILALFAHLRYETKYEITQQPFKDSFEN